MPEMIHLHFERLEPAEQLKRAQEFFDQMARRRTVREFSSEPVPFAVIELAIRAAATAPSGANQQPWTFVVVSDPGLKHEIRVAAEAEEKEFYENRAPNEWLEALAPLGTDWHKDFLETAPYLIVAFRQDYGLNGSGKTKHYYANESVGLACGFLLAALHHAGLVTLTHTPSPMGFLSKLLHRPPNEKPFLLIPVGYPAEGATTPAAARQKKTLDQVLIRF